MTILALGCAGVNCFWDVGAKMEEFSERGELHARDSDTDSESADAKGSNSVINDTDKAGKQGFLYQLGAIKGCTKGCKMCNKTE